MDSSGVLQRTDRPVDTWLRDASERTRSAILQRAAVEPSVVCSYLYASLLGMTCGIDEWEIFVHRNWKKLDHRAVLESEVMALHQDIQGIRQAVEMGNIRQGDAPTKLSYLSRELRGHIEHMARDSAVGDRRALMLAGVETSMKYLKKTLGSDGRIWPVIEASLEAAFCDIEEKNKN